MGETMYSRAGQHGRAGCLRIEHGSRPQNDRIAYHAADLADDFHGVGHGKGDLRGRDTTLRQGLNNLHQRGRSTRSEADE